jgi:hypothetical protein
MKNPTEIATVSRRAFLRLLAARRGGRGIEAIIE